MARALQEFQVLGIRTAIPFFQWLLRQPEFIEGRFDTTYLDGVLARHHGSFGELADGSEEVAAIAAAMYSYLRIGSMRAAAPGRGSSTSAWKQAARREALRS
jgi:acetyl-CoA carboxylase biotin carboxylase subunit